MIEIKHLSKTFQMKDGAVNALKDINLTIPDGSIYGIIGMSGAGKSTLVRCINLLERPTEGSVVIDGTAMETLNAAQLRERRRDITMIFQQFNLLMQRSCLKNICFPMELAGVKKADAEKRARELLEVVGLPDKANAYPAQLSGGQKQRIAIARALATDPKVLLCDEATSALDPNTTHAILTLIKDINKKLGITVVVITHQMSVVEEICDHVARALQVLQNNGVHCCCLPVDEDGLSVEALNRSDAAVCYVTPSHQFPTGVTMPAGRRAELLHWAARRPGGRYIIEDDYDSEFRFDTRPLPSLQGMAGADGPVVYLSTCSRSLAPSIRIAYMVLPEHLLPAWRKKYRLYSGTVSRFEQQTLARFITEGYFTRHLARERVAYKARRDALAAALNTAFAPGELTLAGLHTGLNLLAKLKDPPPDAALRCAAEAEGVQLSLLSDYDLTGEAPSAAGTLVLGYGSLKDEACASVGETLKKVCMAAREASVTV